MYRLSTQEHPQIFPRVPKRFCGKGALNESYRLSTQEHPQTFPRVPKRFCGKGDLNEKLQVVDVRASSNFPEDPQEVLQDRGFGLFRRRDSRFQ